VEVSNCLEHRFRPREYSQSFVQKFSTVLNSSQKLSKAGSRPLKYKG
jgi:hypothetical protein